LDAGIDLAALQATTNGSGKNRDTDDVLIKAIDTTTTVEGKDVALLQRVIANEGEARIALASLLWDAGDRQAAESQLGTACIRLEQLEADATSRRPSTTTTTTTPGSSSKEENVVVNQQLKFSIDD
jgi:hypothetical protein